MSRTGPGILVGIASRSAPGATMTVHETTDAEAETGIANDLRGRRMKGTRRNLRQVTIMDEADWHAALGDLGVEAHWTVRRANLVVRGLALPRAKGTVITIGPDLILSITGECDPCRRMDAAVPGLKAALLPDWRGGRLATIERSGAIALGDAVAIG